MKVEGCYPVSVTMEANKQQGSRWSQSRVCVYNIKGYHTNMNKSWIKHQRANKSHGISAQHQSTFSTICASYQI